MIPSRIMYLALRFTTYVLFGIVFLFLFSPAAAQESGRAVTDDEVNAIAKELYCPICESTPLDVCPTQACKDWREVIRTKLAEGQTEAEIKAYFELQYGARALAEPPQSGFSLSAWIMPIVLVIAVLFGFIYYMRSIRTPQSPQASGVDESGTLVQDPQIQPEPDQDDYVARIERELRDI
jgi:cytochrome c-type biogenesis protein CcmH